MAELSQQVRRPYFRMRKIFGWAFAISTVVCLGAMFFVFADALRFGARPKGSGVRTKASSSSSNSKNDNSAMNGAAATTVVISVVTSLTSLLGFISNTLLMWQREKRDAREAKQKHDRAQLELEQLRRELEANRSSDKDDPQPE